MVEQQIFNLNVVGLNLIPLKKAKTLAAIYESDVILCRSNLEHRSPMDRKACGD